MSTIAVLEDDQRRITAMSAAAKQHFAAHDLRMFISAYEMIAWLANASHPVGLLSLDCDLDANVSDDIVSWNG